MTIDDMARSAAHWPLLADLIGSEQLPPTRSAEIFRDHAPFAQWFAQQIAAVDAKAEASAMPVRVRRRGLRMATSRLQSPPTAVPH